MLQIHPIYKVKGVAVAPWDRCASSPSTSLGDIHRYPDTVVVGAGLKGAKGLTFATALLSNDSALPGSFLPGLQTCSAKIYCQPYL